MIDLSLPRPTPLARLRERRQEMEKTLWRVKWFRVIYPLVGLLTVGTAMSTRDFLFFEGIAALCVEYFILIPRLRRKAAQDMERFAQTAEALPGGMENPERAMQFQLLERSHNLKGICLAGAGMVTASLAACMLWNHFPHTSFFWEALLGACVLGLIAVNCGAILAMLGARVIWAGMRAQAAGPER